MTALPPREPLCKMDAYLRVANWPRASSSCSPLHFGRTSPGRSARVQGSCDNPGYRMSFIDA